MRIHESIDLKFDKGAFLDICGIHFRDRIFYRHWTLITSLFISRQYFACSVFL